MCVCVCVYIQNLNISHHLQHSHSELNLCRPSLDYCNNLNQLPFSVALQHSSQSDLII